jgi:hypothetical protein
VRPSSRHFLDRATPIALLVLGALGTTSCSDPVGTSPGKLPALMTQRTTGVTVSATNPSYGHPGQTGEQVTITGSGFATDATVEWQRNGVADPHVVVRNATVVSATRIDATIDIASDAQLAQYDVAVANGSRTKGIGSELFEITTATSIGTLGGTTQAFAANDVASGARVAGISYVGQSRHGFVWIAPNGPMRDLGPAYVNAIDMAGTAVAGETQGTGAFPALWTLGADGITWSAPVGLPLAPTATGGTAQAIGSDPLTGKAIIVSGSQTTPAARNKVLDQPVLWRWNGSAWSQTVLQLPAAYQGVSFQAYGVNARGQAVGAGGAAIFWDSLGTPTVLPGSPAGTREINADGTIVAGQHNGIAAYWTATVDAGTGHRTWSGPFDLPGGCDHVRGIDKLGNMVAHACPGSRSGAVVWRPPYASYTLLGGLGNSTDAGGAYDISPNGFIVGSAPTGVPNTVTVGAYWTILSP